MSDEGRRGQIAIERGTVKEKRIPEGAFWWEYRVESITRDGIISRWMTSVDVWEHVKIQTTSGSGGAGNSGGSMPAGYAVGTKVYFFLFGDGYGLILDRIVNSAEDYRSRIGVFGTFMETVIEKENLILEKLAELKTQISDAKTDINGHTDSKKGELSTEITNAKTDINTAIGDAKTAINTAIGDAKDSIEGKLTEIKDQEEDIWNKVNE